MEIIAALKDGLQGIAQLSGQRDPNNPNGVAAVLKRGNQIVNLVVDFSK
jgi:hypothetical protein